LLIPVYGYMASAWAHVASYGIMIVMSFIMAEKHYKVSYNMKQFIPYFCIAVGMVILARYINYPDIITELIVNTLMIIAFTAYAQYKDKILTVFFKRDDI
ncbi:MAG TPA: polysaccharide biosynthesis C-terminal domain-containing protein, partial [Bacteroidales bacterium]|nr:polysaccharide biosynthesis C-terminal domain-containing protein [Bacteroidales bacterium]